VIATERSRNSTKGNGFPKSDRIRKRREFLEIQRKGKRIHLSDLVVVCRRGPRKRLGITVTRKVGTAVQRNRIKRLIREVWRRNRELIPSGWELVLVGKRTAVNATYAGLKQQLKEVSRKLSHGGT
jgi:ribonuclease P protein component